MSQPYYSLCLALSDVDLFPKPKLFLTRRKTNGEIIAKVAVHDDLNVDDDKGGIMIHEHN